MITQYTDMTAIVVERSLPMPCLHSATNANVTWAQHFYVPNDNTPNYVGQASLLTWSGFNSTLQISRGDGGIYPEYYGMDESPASDVSVGGYSCPSLGITIGATNMTEELVGTTNTTIKPYANLTFLMCFQRLERVQTKVAFNLPDLSINTTVPPSPDESTVVTVDNPVLSGGVWEWPINTLLTSLTNRKSLSTSLVAAPPGGISKANNLDAFLTTIVAGKPDVPITSLLTSSKGVRERLLDASQTLYQEYMAQAISANMRNTTSLPNVTYPAQISDIPRWRLQQNLDPKIALQAMLGFLAVSAVAMYLIIDTRNVLPHNPCSIAGVATLLADSELVTRDLMPHGAEWASDAQLQRLDVFQGLKFYLGWKRDSEGGRHEDASFGVFLEQ